MSQELHHDPSQVTHQNSSPEMIQHINNLIESYLSSLKAERNFSEHSLRAYDKDLQGFAEWLSSEGYDLNSLDSRSMRSYLAALSLKELSKASINRHLSSTRSFLRWCAEQGIARSTATAISGPKSPRQLPRVVSDADLEKLLQASSTGEPVDLRDDALFELMFATGARISELAFLRLQDIDAREQLIRYWGKGKKERLVPLHALALKKLNRYIEEARPRLIQSKKLDEQELNRVFLGKSGRPLSADSIRVAFKKRLMRVGVDSSITPHDIRHSFATSMLCGGADLRSVQELLGHEQLTTTQIYTHLSIEHLQKVTKQAHPRA
ncbi:MAG: tyrosine recombinase [Coriobacteriia bacterium]|nr:tyrosine recombinase [Coriobacteriia bacterium]